MFIQQPGSTVAGQAISPAVTVQIQDASGNVVHSTAAVTLSILYNPGGATLGGTNPVSAVNSTGVATFSDLSLDKAGTGYTLSATSSGLTAATSTAFNVTAGTAAKLVFIQQPGSTVAGQAISPAVTVQIQDASGNVVHSTAAVTLSILYNPGGATLGGTNPVSAVNSTGVATFSDLSLDKAGTGYTLSATSSGLTGTTSNAFNVIATLPTSVTLSPSPAQMFVRGSLTMTATLNSVAPPGGQLVYLSAGNLLTAPASITIPAGNPSTTFTVTSGNDSGNTSVNASASGLTGSTATVNVQLRSFTLVSPLVGINRAVTASITLDQASPVGGAVFNLSVDNTSIATVSPASITIPEGQTIGTFQLTGGSGTGFTVVRADGSGNGFVIKTLNISVTDHLIDLPAAVNANLGTTLTVRVSISPDQAPTGGAPITVISSNPAIIQVLTPTVTIPEGTFQTTIQVRAVTGSSGSATITASNPDFAPDVMVATVTTGLNIMESFATFSSSDTDTLHLQLLSADLPYPAPAGGVQATLTSSDTTCVMVTSPTTIVEGSTFGFATLSYGSSAALPCSATVTAANALFGSDTVQVTVGQTPDLGAMTITDISPYGDHRIGSGLEAQYRVNLATGSHGGVTIQIKSDNPAVALLAANATTAGSPVIEVTVPNGQNYTDFYLQGVSGATGSAGLTARTARFSKGTVSATVVPPILNIYNLPTSTTNLSANDPFYVRAGYYNTAGTAFQYAYVSGAADLTVTLTSSTPTVGTLVTTPMTGASVTVTIAKGNIDSPGSVATGGAAFDPLTGGTTTVAATAPGTINTYSGSMVNVSVTATPITLADNSPYGDHRTGVGLESRHSITLGGANHGGVSVRVTSGSPSVAKVSLTDTTAGSDFIDVPFANGETVKYFYVQGVSTGGPVTLTATQALFSNGTINVTVVAPILNIYNLPTSTTSLSANDPFYVRAGYYNTAGTAFQYAYVSGAADLTVTLTSSTPAVGTLVTTQMTGASVTVTIAKGNIDSPGSVATGGAAFDPLSVGTTTVAATAPGTINTYSGSMVNVSVTATPITLTDISPYGDYRIGGGLQAQYRVTLGGSSHGGVTIRVASSDSARILLAPNATTAGAAFIDLIIPDGQTTANFYVQGINGVTGNVILTATNAAFVTGTTNVSLVQGAINIYTLSSSLQVTSADDPFYVRAGYLSSNGANFQYAYVSPAGPLHVQLTSSTPAVGQLKTTATTGSQVTVDVAVNAIDSPSTVASGGVAFDPLTTGTSTVSASVIGYNNSWSGAAVAVTITP